MTTKTDAENLRQYKRRFSLNMSRYWLELGALTWLEKLKICLQMLNDAFSPGSVSISLRETDF